MMDRLWFLFYCVYSVINYNKSKIKTFIGLTGFVLWLAAIVWWVS